jgi:uncharacterized protein (DUF2236 family)
MTYHQPSPIILPGPLQSALSAALRAWTEDSGASRFDFAAPQGELALVGADSTSWRIFKNPIALFIGGVAAVILELAEPSVRTGVWKHTSFRDEPVKRLQRTGLAAMITVYGAKSRAEAMIAGVQRLHEKVAGITPSGEAYRASDPELLTWVQATASYGFIAAYHSFVRPLSVAERDRCLAEGTGVAALYGATSAPGSQAELEALLRAMLGRLEPSAIVHEFLSIMRTAPIVPLALRPVQQLLVRAAVEITPPDVRSLLGLQRSGLRSWEHALIRQAGALADRVVLDSSPAVQACRRLGLPADYLYSRAVGICSPNLPAKSRI